MKKLGGIDRFMDRARIVSKYLFPLAIVGLIGGCTRVNIQPTLTMTPEPTMTKTLPTVFTNTPALDSRLLPTVQKTATQEFTLASPTEAVMKLPIPNFKLESPTAVEDMQKLIELYLTAGDIENIVLAPEQVFSDFYNKVIPDISTLRFRSAQNLERMNIGDPIFYHHEIYGDDAKVQVILMGGFKNKNGAYLLLGTENKVTGDRSIVPVQITFGSEGRWSTAGIRYDHDPIKQMGYGGTLDFISAEELLSKIKGRLGKDILTSFSLSHPANEPVADDTKIADQKYFLFERMKSNDLFINDPLSIDKLDLLMSPWIFYIYF